MQYQPVADQAAAAVAGAAAAQALGQPQAARAPSQTSDERADQWGAMKLIYQILFVVAGSVTIVIVKWQDEIVADGKTFSHPLSQCFVMYASFLVCIIPYKFMIRNRTRDGLPLVPGVHVPYESWKNSYAILPGVLHFSSLILTTIGLLYTTASAVQILRGSILIFTAVMSRFVLGREFHPYQIVGMATVIGGLGVVAIAIELAHEGKIARDPLLGNALVVFAQFFSAARSVTEEKLFRVHGVHELILATYEGLTAMCLSLAGMILALILPQSWGLGLGYPLVFIKQLFTSGEAALSVILLIIAQPLLQASAMAIVKMFSATTKTVLTQLRVIGVWALSIAFLGDKFLILEFLGFCVIVFGTALYKKMVPVPSMCLDDEMVADDGPDASVLGRESNAEGSVLSDRRSSRHSEAQELVDRSHKV